MFLQLPMNRLTLHLALLFSLLVLPLTGQTDETIFREFQFDFSTPGARANGMGRAFVGLADEATAAYSNPAGLSVLESPEFSIEGRENISYFPALTDSDDFTLVQAGPEDSNFDLSRVGFLSYSISLARINLSLFFVNILDYRRDNTEDTFIFENSLGAQASYLNSHQVHRVEVSTLGMSISRNFGALNLGVAVARSTLKAHFQYETNLTSESALVFDLVRSNANERDRESTFVIGALYQAHPKLKVGLSYKRQPRFGYTERVTSFEFPKSKDVSVVFKIPDSFQLGLALQPNDAWTLLLDVDWIRYEQLVGNNLTQLSAFRPLIIPTEDGIYRFKESDYSINSDPDIRMGGEFLQPLSGNILALRAGAFLDPDHKTHFVGEPELSGDQFIDDSLIALYDMQNFIYNTEDRKNNVGYTGGIGFVWKNKVQLDVAYVYSDRFRRKVISFLYRF